MTDGYPPTLLSANVEVFFGHESPTVGATPKRGSPVKGDALSYSSAPGVVDVPTRSQVSSGDLSAQNSGEEQRPGSSSSKEDGSPREEVDEAFALTIESGDGKELLHFLRISYAWLKNVSRPPKRDDLQKFVEGGFVGLSESSLFAIGQINNPSRMASVKQKQSSAERCEVSEKSDLLTLITKQREILEVVLERLPEALERMEPVKPVSNSLFQDEIEEEEESLPASGWEYEEQVLLRLLGPDWGAGRLDTFLEAACEATDFKCGSYEPSWLWLRDFYAAGQNGMGPK